MADVPQNGGYLIAAYLVTPVILVGYLVSLWVRVKRLKAEG
jgi:CcmD family protein